jgi:hypothetical protein
MRRRWTIAALLGITLFFPNCHLRRDRLEDGDKTIRPPQSDAAIVVDARVAGAPIQRGLLGWHDWQPYNLSLDKIRAAGEDLHVSFWREVASSDLVYDCQTESFDPSVLQGYMDWMESIQSIGAEPVISLSYVPPCMGHNGESQTYPEDDAEYARFLGVFLDTFVSQRIAAGKPPLRYVESWNEPDGTYFHGTIDDFLARVFIPMGLAIENEKARSGVDIQFGGTASVNGYAFGDIDPDPVRILELIRPDLPVWLCQLAVDVANSVLSPWGGVEVLLRIGGFAWTDRMVEVADAAGFDLDYVSWHTYLNNPLPGDLPVQFTLPPDMPLLDEIIKLMGTVVCGRNPLANIVQFELDAQRWHERYPGKKLMVTEWGIAAGADSRWGTYDDAAFHAAALIAMQNGGVDASLALIARDSSETVWYPHWYFNEMADRTVQVITKDSPEKTGVWALASTDEDAGRVTILAAQWLTFAENATRLPVSLDVFGLRPGRYVEKVYKIDVDHAGSKEPDDVRGVTVPWSGPLSLEVPLDGEAVAFIEIKTEAGAR